MDNLGFRELSKQLADDFAWLEEHCRQRPEKTDVAGPIQRAIGAGVRNRMARESRLRIGLGRHIARQHVGHRALARPRAADDHNVQRLHWLIVEKRPHDVAD